MRRTLRQLLHIAHATALEGLQQPIALLLTLSCVVLTALGPMVHLHAFGEEGRLARDSGLAFMLVFGLLVTGFTAGFTVAEELRRGTAATLLAKPVDRAVFLLGKWLGVATVLLAFCAAALLATLLAERTAERFVETKEYLGSMLDLHSGIGTLAAVLLALLLAGILNYARNLRFGLVSFAGLILLQGAVLVACGFVNRAGELLKGYDPQINARVLPAAFLVFLLLGIHAALATALSTRFRTATVLPASVALLFVGFLADPWLGSSHHPVLRWVYLLVPDMQHFWLADALADGGHIPLRYVAHAVAYAACYSAAVLILGTAAFRHRDIA